MNELAVIVRAVVDDFVSGMNKAKAEVKAFGTEASDAFDKVEERSENLAHVWKSLFEAFIGVEIVKSLVGIAEAANKASETLETAAQNAKNFGKSFDGEQMEAWVKKFAASAQGGGYAVDQMRNSVQRFTSVGLDGAQTQRAIADTANLAAAKNISFSEATQIVTMALTGHIDMLTRYGVISREAAKNIHSTEDAMRALEKATSGDAEKRANGLAGAFGRLHNAGLKLAESFGKQLIPYFVATANALAHMAEAFSNLPDWVQKAAAGITFFSLGIAALGIMLPAVKLGVEFLAGGFGILRTALGLARDAAVLFSNLLIGPLVGAFKGLISYVRTAVVAIGTDLVGAEGAAALGASEFIAPALALIAAIAAISAIVLLLSGHWGDAVSFMSTAWGEFVNGVLKSGPTLQAFFGAIFKMMSPQTYAEGAMELGGVMAYAMPKTAAATVSGVSALESEVKGALNGIWNGIKSFFGAGMGNTTAPTDPFDNTVPGKAGKGAKGGKGAKIKNPDGKGEGTVVFDDSHPADAVMQSMLEQRDTLTRTLEDIRHTGAMAAASGKMNPALAARLLDQEAKAREEIALITEAIEKRKLELAEFAYAHVQNKQNLTALTAAQKAFQKAVDDATTATHKRAEADVAAAGASRGQGNGSILEQLGSKAGIPFNAKGGLDWTSVLMQAVERSKSFADIMKVVNELMNVFAQIIDAFRPVIDLLLKGVIFVANGFIMLWNVIASVLNLFGLHIQKLKELSYDVQDAAAPFINIVHDIPTLNELASGKVGPLYASGTHDTVMHSITDPINNQLQDASLGGGLLGMLEKILGGILALKLIMGLFGGGGGGGGGIFGSILKNFSFGGHTGMSGISAALGGIHLGGATLGGALAAVAGGAILGNFVGDLFGGGSHSSWGSLGGAVGGGLGATLGMFGLAAGPLGALAGMAIGSLIGGVFGHADDPNKMPDKYMPGYQQWLAGYNGSGNQGMQLEGMLKNVDPSKLTGQALADYQRLVQLDGGQKGDNAGLLGIAGEKDGVFTLGTGMTDSVTDFMNLTTRALQELGAAAAQTAGNIAGAAGNITRFVDATTNDLASAAQQSANFGQVIAKTVEAATNAVVAKGPPREARPITLHHYGDINNMGDLEDVGRDLALAELRYSRFAGVRLDRAPGAPTP